MMKKMGKIAVQTALMISLLGVFFMVNAGVKSPWKQIIQCKVTHPTTVAGFINATCGITVGLNGECHYTLDGGKSWPQAQNNSHCRYAMEYVDENTVWNCGNGNQVRVSHDGGQTWTEAASCIIGQMMSFSNAQTGWIASETELVVTQNGGQSWNVLEFPLGKIIAISLLSENEGYILGGNNVLYFTKDGGKTWGTQKAVLKDNLYQPTMRFLDAKRAIIIAFSMNKKKEIALTTLDGGETWNLAIVSNTFGTPYLTRDGKFLTLLDFSQTVSVFQMEG